MEETADVTVDKDHFPIFGITKTVFINGNFAEYGFQVCNLCVGSLWFCNKLLEYCSYEKRIKSALPADSAHHFYIFWPLRCMKMKIALIDTLIVRPLYITAEESFIFNCNRSISYAQLSVCIFLPRKTKRLFRLGFYS